MREWLRARWRSVLVGLAFVGAVLALVFSRVRDSITNRKDTRTDRKLDRAHDAHVAHEARADALDDEAREVEARERQLREQGQMDFGELSAEEVAERFRQLAKERGHQ